MDTVLNTAAPWIGGLGSGGALFFLFWRVIIWADTRTRADNAALREELKTIKAEHEVELDKVWTQLSEVRRGQHSAEDLAAEYKRQLIVAGLYKEPGQNLRETRAERRARQELQGNTGTPTAPVQIPNQTG